MRSELAGISAGGTPIDSSAHNVTCDVLSHRAGSSGGGFSACVFPASIIPRDSPGAATPARHGPTACTAPHATSRTTARATASIGMTRALSTPCLPVMGNARRGEETPHTQAERRPSSNRHGHVHHPSLQLCAAELYPPRRRHVVGAPRAAPPPRRRYTADASWVSPRASPPPITPHAARPR